MGDFLVNWFFIKFGFVLFFYKLGVKLVNLGESLFDYAIVVLWEVIFVFDKKIWGFVMDDVVLIGVEIRIFFFICIKWGDDF